MPRCGIYTLTDCESSRGSPPTAQNSPAPVQSLRSFLEWQYRETHGPIKGGGRFRIVVSKEIPCSARKQSQTMMTRPSPSITEKVWSLLRMVNWDLWKKRSQAGGLRSCGLYGSRSPKWGRCGRLHYLYVSLRQVPGSQHSVTRLDSSAPFWPYRFHMPHNASCNNAQHLLFFGYSYSYNSTHQNGRPPEDTERLHPFCRIQPLGSLSWCCRFSLTSLLMADSCSLNHLRKARNVPKGRSASILLKCLRI